MAKSLRSRKKKRLKASKGELLKTKASWMDAAEEQRQQAMRETLAQPKAELLQEKNTILLEEKRKEEDAARAKIDASEKSENAVRDLMNSVSLATGAEKGPSATAEQSENLKQAKQLRVELATLRRQVGKRRGKSKGQIFQEERKTRIKQILEKLQTMEKSDDVANKVVSIHKSQKQRKPSANPLGVKRGGVTKRKGLSVDSKPAGEKDEDDMDDDSDLVEEVTADEDNAQVVEEGSGGANAFDGGVLLNPTKRYSRRKGHRTKKMGSEWLKKVSDNKMKRYGSTRAARGRNKFQFKGIYQFYPKPASKAGAS